MSGDEGRAWEPVALRLEAGTRVMLRLSGECPSCDADEDTRFVNGALGVVADCPYGDGHEFNHARGAPYRHTHVAGHSVNVRFTPPLRSEQWGLVTGGCYAASELRRLADDGTPG